MYVGPFCCTGETAIVRDVDGKPAGYVYFFGFSGGRNLGPNRSAALTVNILISPGPDQRQPLSARFSAATWTPGTVVTVETGALTYSVAIDPEVIVVNGQKLFDMGSLKATVNVRSRTVARASEPPTEADPVLAEFAGYRAGVAAWFEKNPAAAGVAPTSGSIIFNPGINPFDIDPPDDDSDRSTRDNQLLGLARTTGMLRAKLRASRYPAGLYEPRIRQYERESIQIISGKTAETGVNRLKMLVSGIEQDRQNRRPDLPALSYAVYSAMMNPIPTIFRTGQPGGRVWIISQLRFEVCRAQYRDPYNRTTCRKWRETDPQNPMSLSGTYMFQVAWNGGGNANGQRTVERSANAMPTTIYQVP